MKNLNYISQSFCVGVDLFKAFKWTYKVVCCRRCKPHKYSKGQRVRVDKLNDVVN